MKLHEMLPELREKVQTAGDAFRRVLISMGPLAYGAANAPEDEEEVNGDVRRVVDVTLREAFTGAARRVCLRGSPSRARPPGSPTGLALRGNSGTPRDWGRSQPSPPTHGKNYNPMTLEIHAL